MLVYYTLLAAGALAGTASAAPSQILTRRQDAGVAATPAADLIKTVIPDSKSCDNAQSAFKDQCRTADQAAQPFINAFAKYEIYNHWEIAAVLALVGHESAGLKFKQPMVSTELKLKGTSNMQSEEFNMKYALSIPEISADVQQITGGETNYKNIPDDKRTSLLKLLQDDKYNFASGPWFYATQCNDSQIKSDLRAGKKGAFVAYLNKCIVVSEGTTEGEKTEWANRMTLWGNAKSAFKLTEH